MTGYCVSDIAAITGGALSGDGAAPVTGAVIDSRAVTPGALFAAIPGERVDGHDYIGKAFDLGASCCLAQRVPAGEVRRAADVDEEDHVLPGSELQLARRQGEH